MRPVHQFVESLRITDPWIDTQLNMMKLISISIVRRSKEHHSRRIVHGARSGGDLSYSSAEPNASGDIYSGGLHRRRQARPRKRRRTATITRPQSRESEGRVRHDVDDDVHEADSSVSDRCADVVPIRATVPAPKANYSLNDTCPICRHDTVVLSTNCLHRFCGTCLSTWGFKRRGTPLTCPLCRNDVYTTFRLPGTEDKRIDPIATLAPAPSTAEMCRQMGIAVIPTSPARESDAEEDKSRHEFDVVVVPDDSDRESDDSTADETVDFENGLPDIPVMSTPTTTNDLARSHERSLGARSSLSSSAASSSSLSSMEPDVQSPAFRPRPSSPSASSSSSSSSTDSVSLISGNRSNALQVFSTASTSTAQETERSKSVRKYLSKMGTHTEEERRNRALDYPKYLARRWPRKRVNLFRKLNRSFDDRKCLLCFADVTSEQFGTDEEGGVTLCCGVHVCKECIEQFARTVVRCEPKKRNIRMGRGIIRFSESNPPGLGRCPACGFKTETLQRTWGPPSTGGKRPTDIRRDGENFVWKEKCPGWSSRVLFLRLQVRFAKLYFSEVVRQCPAIARANPALTEWTLTPCPL